MSRDRAAKRSLAWFLLALVPLTLAALSGRPGAGGSVVLGLMIATVGIYELVRGAE